MSFTPGCIWESCIPPLLKSQTRLELHTKWGGFGKRTCAHLCRRVVARRRRLALLLGTLPPPPHTHTTTQTNTHIHTPAPSFAAACSHAAAASRSSLAPPRTKHTHKETHKHAHTCPQLCRSVLARRRRLALLLCAPLPLHARHSLSQITQIRPWYLSCVGERS